MILVFFTDVCCVCCLVMLFVPYDKDVRNFVTKVFDSGMLLYMSSSKHGYLLLLRGV